MRSSNPKISIFPPNISSHCDSTPLLQNQPLPHGMTTFDTMNGLKSEIIELQSTLKNKNEEIASLKQVMMDWQRNSAMIRGQVFKLVMSRKQECLESKQQIETMKVIDAQKDGEIRDLNQRITEMESELVTLYNDYNDIRNKSEMEKSAKSEIKTILKENGKLKKRVKSLQKMNGDLNEEIKRKGACHQKLNLFQRDLMEKNNWNKEEEQIDDSKDGVNGQNITEHGFGGEHKVKEYGKDLEELRNGILEQIEGFESALNDKDVNVHRLRRRMRHCAVALKRVILKLNGENKRKGRRLIKEEIKESSEELEQMLLRIKRLVLRCKELDRSA